MGNKMPSMKDMQKIGKEVQEYILEQRNRMKQIEEDQAVIKNLLEQVVGNGIETT